jgi:hypothetical protein
MANNTLNILKYARGSIALPLNHGTMASARILIATPIAGLLRVYHHLRSQPASQPATVSSPKTRVAAQSVQAPCQALPPCIDQVRNV